MEKKYKYNISERIAALSFGIRYEVRKNMIRRCAVSVSTFSRWLNARQGDKLDIPGDALLIISEELKVPMEELFNKDINPSGLPTVDEVHRG